MVSVLIAQLPDVSDLVLNIGETTSRNGILIMYFGGRQPTYRETRYNEQRIGEILDSTRGC